MGSAGTILLGSDRWPATITVGGVGKQLGHFVQEAFLDSAVDDLTWNSTIFEKSREMYIERAIRNEMSEVDLVTEARDKLTEWLEAYPVHGDPIGSLDVVMSRINDARKRLL